MAALDSPAFIMLYFKKSSAEADSVPARQEKVSFTLIPPPFLHYFVSSTDKTIYLYHEGILFFLRKDLPAWFFYAAFTSGNDTLKGATKMNTTTYTTSKKNTLTSSIKKTITSGVCLALCFFLPFLTGQIPQIGSALAPMHIPVLICGLVCGWPYGLLVGLIAPILRSLTFGMPPLFPTATAMAFEMAAYGAFSGILYKLLPKKALFLYASLIGSMLLGRIVWGIATLILLGINGQSFTFSAFLAGAFTNAIPGIICHILLIPPIVMGLKKARLAE